MQKFRLLALVATLPTFVTAQVVVTSTATAIFHDYLSGTSQSYDYIVSSGFGGASAPAFTADLKSASEFVYHIQAPAGYAFQIEFPTFTVATAYFAFETYWSSGATLNPGLNVANVAFTFDGYDGPGLGTGTLPFKITGDGLSLGMTGSQFIARGTHTFTGFSIAADYSNFDTTSWSEGSYSPFPFRIYYYTLGYGGIDPGQHLSLVAIPEPSTVALVIGICAALAACCRTPRWKGGLKGSGFNV